MPCARQAWTCSCGPAPTEQRDQIRPGRPRTRTRRAARRGHRRGAELEGITAVLLLTDEDDFNALAATVLAGNPETQVYRLPPRQPSHGVVAPYTGGETVFAPTLTRRDIAHRHNSGARITLHRRRPLPPGTDLLFLINPDGALHPATTSRPPTPQPGDTLVLLGRMVPCSPDDAQSGTGQETSAVRPAWITGRKLPPRPLLGVVLLPFEQEHVVTQQDQ